MSIILDALRRADAERQRRSGAVPGLNDPLSVDLAPATPASRYGRWWLVGGVVGMLVLAGVWFGGRSAPVASSPSLSLPNGSPQGPGPALRIDISQPQSPLSSAEAQVPPVPGKKPADAVDGHAPTAQATPVSPSAAKGPALTPTKPSVTEAQAPPVKAPRTAERRSDEDRALPMAQRPAAARAALPSLKVDGVMHSDQASSRLLFLNGQMLREGDVIASDWVLEHIGPKAAVLRWQGQRFELPY